MGGRIQVIIYSLQEEEPVDPYADAEVLEVDPNERAYGQTAPTGMIEIDASLATDTPLTRIQHVAAHELFHKFEAVFMRRSFAAGDKFDLWYLEGMAEAAAMHATGGLISNSIRITYFMKDTNLADLPFFETSYLTVTFWLWLWARNISWIHEFMTTYQSSIEPDEAFETFSFSFLGNDGPGIGSSLLGMWAIDGLYSGQWNKTGGSDLGSPIFNTIVDAGTGARVSTARDDSNLIVAAPRESWSLTKPFSVLRGGVVLSAVTFEASGYGNMHLNFNVRLDDPDVHWSGCISIGGREPTVNLNANPRPNDTIAVIAIATAMDWRNESLYNDHRIKTGVSMILTDGQA